MNILIVGKGGREHALAWKLSQSRDVKQIYVAPGNAGTKTERKTTNIDIQEHDISGLIEFCKKNEVRFSVVGPEVPLSLGIVDQFEHNGLQCFGPKKKCAQLESSKIFSKNFMRKYNIPTAEYKEFNNEKSAKLYAEKIKYPVVIKANGLAAGKGVVIVQNAEEAKTTITNMMKNEKFGEAGKRIIFEEFLAGKEASFIAICDGKNAVPLASSQDHKARDDGNKGPNTGGMGAYSPSSLVNESMQKRVMDTIINPVLTGMKNEGQPYTGFLYAGLMIMEDGTIKTLEYNCRLGDPETQPIMMRLDSDLADLIINALDTNLNNYKIQWKKETALGVVMASGGYPQNYKTGYIINGLNTDNGISNKIFHAGSEYKNKDIVNSGGRVLCVTSLGNNLQEAHENSYGLVDKISWKDEYHRTDIGK